MCALLLLAVFLYGVINTNGQCLKPDCQFVDPSGRELNCTLLKWPNCKNTVNLSNKGIEYVEIQTNTTFQSLVNLDISNNKLTHLPEHFLYNAFALKEINLSNNMLKSLPENFLRNSSKLENIRLEGNQLSFIPSSIFHRDLVNITTDCNCKIAGTLIQDKSDLCNNMTKCPSITCQTASGSSSVDDYYKKECGYLLILYIAIPIVILVLVIGGVILFVCKRKRKHSDFESKSVTDKSPAHSQPRYMTRNVDSVPTASKSNPRQDYENVVIGYMQPEQALSYEYPNKSKSQGTNSNNMMEEIYLESDVNDQPIYNNTQDVYYNYTDHGPINKEEEDVYIVPDQ
ncbi:uncharacterized protein LOC128649600 [Bombina bombina]|uniref:uncharacterized protein LOC128649600 n=1 Tax=Bombina bombina TaxID=8345 RepID=UPI00235B201E|nr:uncharacterized protein LOC128649600 [Bombina bombina]